MIKKSNWKNIRGRSCKKSLLSRSGGHQPEKDLKQGRLLFRGQSTEVERLFSPFGLLEYPWSSPSLSGVLMDQIVAGGVRLAYLSRNV